MASDRTTMRTAASARGSCAGAVLVLTLALAAALAAATGGCTAGAERQTPYMRSIGTITVSTETLRIRTRAFAHLFMSTVESAADRIRRATEDREVEEFALLWKMQSVPMVQQAAFHSDPLAAMIDLWALTEQLHDAFTRGYAGSVLGDLAPIAVEAVEQLQREILRIANDIGTGARFEEGAELVRRWADEHPIKGRYFIRTSVVQDLEQLSGTYRRVGGLAAVGSFDERVRVMLDRMPFYTEFLPKQVVWQTELVLTQNAQRIRDETGLDELEHLRRLEAIETQLAAIAAFTGGVDAMASEQVGAAIEALAEEVAAQRRLIFEEVGAIIEQQRTMLMRDIAAEREAATRDVASIVEAERTILLADIERQRLETLDAIRAERDIILSEARTIATNTAGDALRDARGLIDHLVLRIAQLAAAIGVVVLLVVIVLRKLWGGGRTRTALG